MKSIANDLGVDWATIRNYIQILKITLVRFFPALHSIVRYEQQQLQSNNLFF